MPQSQENIGTARVASGVWQFLPGNRFLYLKGFFSLIILLFILLPLLRMVTQPSLADLLATISDPEVRASLWLSIYTAGAAAAIAFLFGTPLTWRHMLCGVILCAARAVSEFGAVVIVAYHPMIAPVLMFERFTAYGLK